MTMPLRSDSGTDSPLFCSYVEMALSKVSIFAKVSPEKSNCNSDNSCPADLLLIIGSYLSTSNCHALRPSDWPAFTMRSSAVCVQVWSSKW